MGTTSLSRCLITIERGNGQNRVFVVCLLTYFMKYLRQMNFDFITLKQMIFSLFTNRWNQIELACHGVGFLEGEERIDLVCSKRS